MAEYKIELGVKLRTSDIRTQVSEYNNNSNNAKLKLGVKLDTRGIGDQIKAINSKTPVKVAIKLDAQNAKKQIGEIRKQIQQLGNIKINLGGAGVTTGNAGGKNAVNNVNKTAKELTTAYNK